MWTDLLSRRSALKSAACGFGWLAFSGLAALQARASALPHFRPRARRMIFIFMQGGPSQVDTFDYKPLLAKWDGRMLPFDDPKGQEQRVMKSLWEFNRHGQSGRWISELFPHLAHHADDLCFIHSMRTEGMSHGPATLFLHCGSPLPNRPSIGSWIDYGLGTENENLPGFVTISPSMGNGGPRNYGTGFLPANCQGVPIGRAGLPLVSALPRNLPRPDQPQDRREREFDLIQALNRAQLAREPAHVEVEATIRSFELAWRYQSAAPEVLDLSKESPETLALYGIGSPATDNFGRQCLLARRLSEAGVRFVQITHGDNTANPAWDQHSNLIRHADHARAVDQPVAALLTDLKRRGLLDDTIIWWGSEFGRTPFAERNGTGRDHNPGGFTVWLAGAGVKPGFALGETDAFGHRAAEHPVHMHDLHATLLHLLGLDHERLTAHHLGRDFRLTDVAGSVIHPILS